MERKERRKKAVTENVEQLNVGAVGAAHQDRVGANLVVLFYFSSQTRFAQQHSTYGEITAGR
jgi:hypothetical protein